MLMQKYAPRLRAFCSAACTQRVPTSKRDRDYFGWMLVRPKPRSSKCRGNSNAPRRPSNSVRLANLRYDSGLSSYFEVIDAKLNLFPVQNTAVQYDLERKVALVNLYKALGGGWKLSDTDWLKAAAATPPSSPPNTNP
jgi:hypothetical protein